MKLQKCRKYGYVLISCTFGASYDSNSDKCDCIQLLSRISTGRILVTFSGLYRNGMFGI